MTRVFGGATTLLLWSTGLLNYAQGSFSSHDNKVFSDYDFAAVKGQFERNPAQTSKHNDVPSAPVGAAATTGNAGGDQAPPDAPRVDLTLMSEMVQASALSNNSNNNSRSLQEADCSAGATSLMVSSTMFPLLEGCLSPSVVGGWLQYTSATGTILRLESTNTASPPLWFAYYDSPSGEFTTACASGEDADLVDPSETTWYCDTDGDGEGFLLADDELSVSCGCSITSPSPMTTAAPAPSTTVPACSEGDSFSIASATLPDAEGCYINTQYTFNDQIIYTTSGNADLGQIMMYAVQLTGADASSTAGSIVWAFVDVALTGESADSMLYCISEVEAAFYHPSEVPSWPCIEGVTIDVTCDCSSSPSPGPPSPVSSTVPPSTPTPVAQPVVPPSAQPAGSNEAGFDTCPGDGSFTITANAAPELSGCFTGSTRSDGSFMYTVSGTTTQYEASVITQEDEDGNFHWYLGFLSVSEDSSGDTQLYCVSLETASDADPGDASWSCDFTGNAANFSTATEEDLSIVCGSCATSESTPQPAASTLSPLTPTPVSPISRGTSAPIAPPTTPSTAESTPTPSVVAGGPPSVADTCSGDGSFTITANAAPNLDGCFKDTGLSTELYTVSGTDTQSGVAVLALETDGGNFNWFITFISLDDDDEETRGYCVSVESASDVHPGNASWGCDFTGNTENVLAASENDISISCGSCAETEDSSTASKLGVGVVAAGGAGMVVVASAFADWC